jgi:hypothetical protein
MGVRYPVRDMHTVVFQSISEDRIQATYTELKCSELYTFVGSQKKTLDELQKLVNT